MKTKRQLFTAAAAAVLAAAASLSAAAAQRGWQQEGDKWVYYDTSGEKVTSSWVKGADGERYYVDEEGCMVVNTIVKDGKDIYYTNEDGVRVKNQWASEPNVDGICDQDVDILWYYFGDDGKAITREEKAVKLTVDGQERTYFFDSDGHMLNGWQRIQEASGDTHTYYLGNENEGYAHQAWQYLEPDEKNETVNPGDNAITNNPEEEEYDGAEMYYFGWRERATTGESLIDDKWYFFDDNGVMLRGWQPRVMINGAHVGINRYYDQVTGARMSGWLYAYGVDESADDPYWFYLGEKDGIPFNEGAKDSDDRLAFKEIKGLTYFFDQQGRMITGLISTGGKGLADCKAIQEKYWGLKGDIGKGKGKKPAGIYYLSLEDRNLGKLITSRRINVGTDEEPLYYHFDSSGRAYENAMVNGYIYGDDGLMLRSRQNWALIDIENDIYLSKDYSRGELKDLDTAVAVIPSGSQVLISTSGKVKKEGIVQSGGVTYRISNYIAEPK